MRRIGLIVGLLLFVGTVVGAVVTVWVSGSDEKHESTTVSSVAVASDSPAPVDASKCKKRGLQEAAAFDTGHNEGAVHDGVTRRLSMEI